MGTSPFETICIYGSGYMGAQIGLHCAAHGHNVRFFDIKDKALQSASELHVQELDARVDKGNISSEEKAIIKGHMLYTTDISEGVSNADLVIEAIPERLEIKRDIFSKLDKICQGHTILATNSSSIRISTIEHSVKRRDKVLNMHFYSPVWQRTMVELMRGTSTSDKTINLARQFAQAIGLIPLIVRKESTGFIFNRVWRAIKKECLHLVDAGVAFHEDVDRAWMIALGVSIGPFGLMDRVGLDVVRDIEMIYYNESGDESDAPPRLLQDKIEKGELGIKTGKGFYNYPDPAFLESAWLKNK